MSKRVDFFIFYVLLFISIFLEKLYIQSSKRDKKMKCVQESNHVSIEEKSSKNNLMVIGWCVMCDMG